MPQGSSKAGSGASAANPDSSSQVTGRDWYGMPVADVARILETSPASGISDEEAARRQERYGPNEIQESSRRGPWQIAIAQFKDFMIVVLLVAAVISGFVGDPEDSIAIVAIVILNAIIGFVQEYRAQRAMEMLKRLAAHQAHVMRDGRRRTVSAKDLVPGDLVLLEAGNSVPADLRITHSAQLRIEEAALTGESNPVEKQTNAVESAEHLPLGDRTSMAFKGTAVTYGRGNGIVVETGMRTELGRIAELLKDQGDTRTPLQKRLAGFGKSMALIALGICAIVFAVGVQRGQPVVLMFLTSVSLAVAAIPEALPAVVTIALALGARRMLRLNALVRKLPAVETLGSVTFICSDKTGTLTENRMQVTSLYVDGARSPASDGDEIDEDSAKELLFQALALSNDASVEDDGSVVGDPTEVALLEAARAAGFDKTALENTYPRISEVPFDSTRKRMTTIHEWTGGARRAFVKGAPEAVLDRCVSERTSGGEHSLEAKAGTQGILEVAEQMAAEGLRVLAVAYRPGPFDLSSGESAPEELRPDAGGDGIEQELIFLGLAGLIDPPRPEAKQAVRECQEAGITPVMITGDHPATALAIARQLGIADESSRALTGAQLAQMDPGEFQDHVKRVRVYARVSPEQKLNIVDALQTHGEYVAMTGDGVNDAPALQRSDIGVAMGKIGTDVAREAGDLVLLDDNFATIVRAVREGRHIFDNIRKFVKYIITSNMAEVLTIFVAPLLGLPVPLLPIHILWINLMTDGLPGLALAVEPEEPGLMERPPRPPSESLFAHGMWQHMVWGGILMAGLSIFSQAWAIDRGSPEWQTVVFTVLTMTQMSQALSARSESHSLFRIGLFNNLPLLGAIGLTIGLQLCVIYLPVLQGIFRTGPLSGEELLLVGVLAGVMLLAAEFEKWLVVRFGLFQGSSRVRAES